MTSTPRPQLAAAEAAGVPIKDENGNPRPTQEIFEDLANMLQIMEVQVTARSTNETYRRMTDELNLRNKPAHTSEWALKVIAEAEEVSLEALKRLPAVGSVIPHFELESVSGAMVNITGLLAKGPLVLVATRGQWCEYCQLQLQAFADLHAKVQAHGGTVVAITGTTRETAMKMKEMKTVPFDVLMDPGSALMQKLGIAYKVPKGYKEGIKLTQDVDVEEIYGTADVALPVFSATLVVTKVGKVAYAFASENPFEVADPEDILREVYIASTMPFNERVLKMMFANPLKARAKKFGVGRAREIASELPQGA